MYNSTVYVRTVYGWQYPHKNSNLLHSAVRIREQKMPVREKRTPGLICESRLKSTPTHTVRVSYTSFGGRGQTATGA